MAVGAHSESVIMEDATVEFDPIVEEMSAPKFKIVDFGNRRVLWGLKPSEEAKVDELMRRKGGNDAEQICNRVILRSLRSLLPGRWLNDEIINEYLRILVSKHNEVCRQKNQRLCHAYNTAFMFNLISRNADDEKYNYEEVRRWSKKVPGKNLFDLDKLFIPINQNNTHWMLVVVSFQECCIRFYDSQKRDRRSGPDQKYLQWIKMYIKDERHKLPLHDWKSEVTPPETPTQSNGFDCGVFVCSFVELIIAGRPLTFCQEDVTKNRNRIAWTLIQAGKTDDVKAGKG
jgi:sentrin-specific protease 1